MRPARSPHRLGHKHRTNAPYRLFETADGRYIAVTAARDGFFRDFMSVIGLERHLSDPRFATYLARKENEDALIELVAPVIRTWRGAELEQAWAATGIPCSLVNDYGQVFSDPQIEARAMVVEVDHPVAGRQKALRNPVLLDGEGLTIARPAPLLGEHTAEVLAELGYDETQISALSGAGTIILPGRNSQAANPSRRSG